MSKKHPSKNWEETLRPEHRIVLCCARAAVHSASPDPVRALARCGLDWQEVAAYAARHRLSPVVYETIAGPAQDLVSPAQLDRLRQSAESCKARGMAFLQELLRLQSLFEAARIPAIPYKGPVLAQVAYGSFARREYSDLDFAVRQEFIPDVVAALKSAGYCPQFDLREAHPAQKRSFPGQYAFFLNAQGLLVEVHTERTLRYFPRSLDFQELTTRLMEVEISGRRLRTFSIADTLVMLCVHGAKHFWERIAWVLDVAKLAALPEVDWAPARSLAAKAESSRALRLGLYLAHNLLAAPLPQYWREDICQDRAVPELAEKVCRQYAGLSDPGAGIFSRAMFRIRVGDEFGQGFRHMLRLTASPTEIDRQTVPLPPWLAPLYPLVRPWRLLREYGLGSKRR